MFEGFNYGVAASVRASQFLVYAPVFFTFNDLVEEITKRLLIYHAS